MSDALTALAPEITIRNYELLGIFPGTLSEAEILTSVDTIRRLLTSLNVENLADKSLGKNRLAYPIKNIRYGYFYNFNFSTSTVIIKQLEAKLRLDKTLLRSTLTLLQVE